jgi:actin related protein 2/3 complex subunit 2
MPTVFLHTENASPRLSECSDSVSVDREVFWVCFIILYSIYLLTQWQRAPPVNIDQTVSDFDGVTFHISTPEAKTKIVVSIQIRCYKELLQYGAQQVLEREYGPYVIAPEAGYDFSVQVNLDDLPEDKGRVNHIKRRYNIG